MKTNNAENEKFKRRYFSFLKEAKRHSEQSVDAAAKALSRFEQFTKMRSFKQFHIEQAIAFKRFLAEQVNQRTGEQLSKATIHSTLKALRNFFHWLAGQPGFRSRLSYGDAEYFNLSEKDVRIAQARREPRVPTLEQIKHVLSAMPCGSEIERRDKALVAFTLLTGARDRAIASLKLKHVDLGRGCVHQDARDVQTKFSKTFTTYFFPVGDEVRSIVHDWVVYLLREKLWGLDDPLFPGTQMGLNEDLKFQVVGIDRKHWGDAGPIRRIFKEALVRAGYPLFQPA